MKTRLPGFPAMAATRQVARVATHQSGLLASFPSRPFDDFISDCFLTNKNFLANFPI
jgi:hypothetical protein